MTTCSGCHHDVPAVDRGGRCPLCLLMAGGPEPVPYRDAITESHEWAARAADLWWSIANRYALSGLFPKLYLYVRDNAARDPAWLSDLETPDPAWTLANPEPASPAWTRGQVGAWIREFVGRLPILPA